MRNWEFVDWCLAALMLTLLAICVGVPLSVLFADTSCYEINQPPTIEQMCGKTPIQSCAETNAEVWKRYTMRCYGNGEKP